MELTIKIDSDSNSGKALLLYLMSLAETNDFLVIEGEKTKYTKEQVAFLENFKQSLKDVKLHKKGKLKLQTARELLNEL